MNLKNILESIRIEASAPCRIDMGGTLDISTFYLPLRHLNPCTFNVAINLRTTIRMYPYRENYVRIMSKGFEPAEFSLDTVPFSHPLGLMFAVAAYFNADGVSIEIDSESPPRSALGGSSSAAVALTAAFLKLEEIAGHCKHVSKDQVAILAHLIEAGVAGVPCGTQDQLAAVYGGIHAWYWQATENYPFFIQKAILTGTKINEFEGQFLLAYCGIPHESKNINKIWVDQFLSGKFRSVWYEIIECIHRFVEAIESNHIPMAVEQMNRETELRRQLTPDVLDSCGKKLVESAKAYQCGARFTGAGGGGCVWAFGSSDNIHQLKPIWQTILTDYDNACLLPSIVDTMGLKIHVSSSED